MISAFLLIQATHGKNLIANNQLTFEQALRRRLEVEERDYDGSGLDIWNGLHRVRQTDAVHLSYLVENGWLEQIISKVNPPEGTVPL